MLRSLAITIALAVPLQALGGGVLNDLKFWQHDASTYNAVYEFYQKHITVAVSFASDVPEDQIPDFFKQLFDTVRLKPRKYPIGVVVDQDCYHADAIVQFLEEKILEEEKILKKKILEEEEKILKERFSKRRVILVTGRNGDLGSHPFTSHYVANPYLRMELFLKADKFYPSQESPMALVASMNESKDTTILCSTSVTAEATEPDTPFFGFPTTMHPEKFGDKLEKIMTDTPKDLGFHLKKPKELAEFLPPKFSFGKSVMYCSLPTLRDEGWVKSIWNLFNSLQPKQRCSFFASGKGSAERDYGPLTRAVAVRAAHLGYTVLTGGAGGLMEPANQAAKDWDGDSVGVNLGGHKTERCQRGAHTLSLGTSGYEQRIPCLLMGCQRVNVLPGGTGTLKEVATSLTFVNSLISALTTKKGSLAGYDEDPDFKLIFLSSSYYQGLFDLMTSLKWGRFLHDEGRLVLIDNAREIAANF